MAETAANIVHVPMNIPLPPKLDLKGSLSTNWKKFKRVWENYEIATRLCDQDSKYRTATLLTCIGGDALEIVDGLSFDQEDDRKNIDCVMEKLQQFCIGETNETYERYCFNRRDQEPFESIDTYVAAIRNLAKTCNYGTIQDSLIRDRLVMGIRDNNTRKRLLQQANLTLKSCIDTCRAHETAAQQMKSISDTGEVQVLSYNHRPQKIYKQNMGKSQGYLTCPKRSYGKSQVYPKKSDEISCKFCGRFHPMVKESCPAWGKLCNSCNRRNHFSVKCPGKMKTGKRIVHAVEDHVESSNESTDSEEYVMTMETKESISYLSDVPFPKRIFAKMILNDSCIQFQLDCGATVNILPEPIYVKLYNDPELAECKSVSTTLVMFNGTETKPIGHRRVSMRNPKNQKKYSVDMLIVKGNCKPLLGAGTVQQMGLITVNNENILTLSQDKPKLCNAVEMEPVKMTLDKMSALYHDVFEGEGKFEGELHLEIDKTVSPVKLPCRKVPIAVRPKLKEELDRLEKMEIIKPVTTPTDWISAMVVVTKPDGKVRLCVDPKPLNKALKRNHYPMPIIDDILPDLSGAKLFTVADAKNGFWHVQLDEESSLLTTFATSWGRYRWVRMPFGISPAPEEFQRRLNENIEGLDGVRAVHDDVIIYGVGETDAEAELDHDRKFVAFLDRCRDKNIKLNKHKLKFKQRTVPYLGHILSPSGVEIDPSKVEAISKMPAPTDKHGVQRILGMVNFLQKFAPSLSEITAPLRELLKNENEFIWSEDVHGKCLLTIKQILTSPPVLRYFDNKLETVLQCDASQNGLGACLMQQGQPIAYASRSLTSAEKNYAQIEKEMLAIVFGMERFEHYVYGRRVDIESDHKPLESILSKSLHSAPKRLQRMMLRLQKFDFEVSYKKGAHMFLADTLSRAYLPHTVQEKNDRDEVMTVDKRSQTAIITEAVNMTEHIAISEKKLIEIQRSTESDANMVLLKGVIQQGWPDTKEEVPYSLRDYFPYRDELSIQNAIIFKGERVIIPQASRLDIMKRIHSSHIGMQGCIRRARELVFWPNMSKELTEYIGSCETCNKIQQEQGKEPLICHEIPGRPWAKVGCDLFEFNQKDYLVTVDYYSDYFEIDRLHDKRSTEVINKIKAHCARHGIPDCVMSDNGPQFNSDAFRRFSDQYEFDHITSSPRYPQSNGKVESAVKIIKRLMKKALLSETDPFLALLDWRNVPTEGMGSSPVQRLFGRRTKTLLPTTNQMLKPKTVENVSNKIANRKIKQSKYYNRTAHELSGLQKGDVVRIKPVDKFRTWEKATVDKQVDIRSYNVRTEDGRIYRRNRKHLRVSTEPTPIEPVELYSERPVVDDGDNQPPEVNDHAPRDGPIVYPVPATAVVGAERAVITASGRIVK